MPEQKFNQPYYKIHFAELDDDIMGVVSFEGEEEISGLYEFRIKLASLDSKVDSAKILNKTAVLTLIRPDQSTREIHGYISSFEQTGKSRDYIFYKVVLVPRLWQLNLIFQNEIYQNLEMNELIAKVLEGCKLSGGDLKVDLKNKPPKIEFIVQYRETSLNFLNRRLEHYGIYYYFDQSGDEDVVYFVDDNSKLPSIDSSEKLGFNENREPLGSKESVLEFICREKVVTGSVQLKDYNYMFPEKQLMAQSQIDSKYPGTFYDYGDHFENEKDADFLAKIRNQEILCQSKIFYGNSDCRLLSAGYKFSLEKHYRDDWNGDYIITSITHKGNQHNLFSFQHQSTKDKPYENNFTAIPDAVDFRPIRRAHSPKIYGVMNAKIDDSTDGKYASIDEHGRYKVKIPFDLSDKKNGEASLFIRMTQSYSGENYGIHFPLHKGAEVLLTFIDGNPDRPVISGTVPNPSNASPVKADNHTQSMIRTAGGNELKIEDADGAHLIKLSSPHKNTTFRIGAPNSPGDPGVETKTEGSQYTKIGEHKIEIVDGKKTTHIGGEEYEVVDGEVTHEFKDDTHEIIRGKMTEEFYGDKSETVHGTIMEKFMGAKFGVNLSAALEIFLAAEGKIFGGIAKEIFIGVALQFALAAKVTWEKGHNYIFSEIADHYKGKEKEADVRNDYKIKVGKDYDLKVGKDFKTDVDGIAVLKAKEGFGIRSNKDLILVSKSGKPIIMNTKELRIKAKIAQANLTVDK